jgi:plasmid stability protein
MPTLTIRNLPQAAHDALKTLAARNGRSMEAEARRIIGSSVAPASDQAAFEAAVRDAQEAFAAYRRPTVLLSEELIADRRLEARKEAAEMSDWRAPSADSNRPNVPARAHHAKPRS